jgi:Arc/MetJ family transcription regulator
MRTNIELDDDLMEKARRYSDAPTKRALVEEALQTFVDVRAREQRRSRYGDRLAAVRARTGAIKLKRSAVDILREDRRRS